MSKSVWAMCCGLALSCGFFFGLEGQSSVNRSAIAIQQGGTAKGGAAILNCGTNMTCTLSGGKVTISAAGGGGTIANTTNPLRGDGAGNAVDGGANGTGNIVQTTGPALNTPTLVNPDLGNQSNGSALSETWTVGASTVTQSTLVQIDASNPSLIVPLTSGTPYGIAETTVTSGNPVKIARYGFFTCVADNATTAGHIAIAGTSTAIDCRDSGQTSLTAIPSGTYAVGIFRTNQTAGTATLISLGMMPYLTSQGSTNQNIRTIGASFGSFQSGATALSAAATACVPTYAPGTIQSVEIIGNASGSATIDVQTVLHASWTGTGSVSSITASDIPALSSAASYTDSTLTGWTKTIAANTDVCFVMTSPVTVAGLSITLKVAVTP